MVGIFSRALVPFSIFAAVISPAPSLPALTDGLRLRFTASDYGADNTVEAAIDDIEITACPDEDPAGVEENVTVDTPEQVELLGSRHNPFANSTHVFFDLPRRMKG